MAAERPGGRTAAVRAAVLRATADLLIEAGLEGLELTAVAERAGVGKSTVYRRWGSVPALVADLLADKAEQSVSRTDTGSLRGDLRANATLVRRTLNDARQGRLFKAAIAAATCDQHTAAALQVFYDRRIAEWAGCVTDAVERGEAPAGTDAAAVIRQVSAPLYYQFLTSTRTLTVADADRAVDAAIAAAEAGVFT
ncbi:TetR/AcrR family transcriptional regulator [Mycolicibacterium nivoides]|jgi:AcrR family transcriptional regulator|uniref:TetR/AcrR family transcriptional regulator n=1 Tax=Mycolicibacterium nivoides TaxID=2487344 RepID=UPI0008BAE1F0|nr:TetR/AcrR family transcriptional regulator [Mycolicibacterium nivoides]SEQ75581.1 DNA-binding transcriptional regulator, AcrR family [Mycobacterium sp. 88mf]SFF60870.1 DNA-binding transcriptional regulator, AcrR family [Mycobacterium sp. 455mf]